MKLPVQMRHLFQLHKRELICDQHQQNRSERPFLQVSEQFRHTLCKMKDIRWNICKYEVQNSLYTESDSKIPCHAASINAVLLVYPIKACIQNFQ